MDAIDIFLLVIIAAGAILGYRRGLVMQIGHIAGVIGSVVICRLFGGVVADLFGAESATAVAMAYIATFVVGYLAAYMLSRTLDNVLHALNLGIVDHLAGAVFKVLQYMLVVSVMFQLWFAINPSEREEVCSVPWHAAVVELAPTVLSMTTQDDAADQQELDNQNEEAVK
jgi:membrane protein required for colicin V production